MFYKNIIILEIGCQLKRITYINNLEPSVSKCRNIIHTKVILS